MAEVLVAVVVCHEAVAVGLLLYGLAIKCHSRLDRGVKSDFLRTLGIGYGMGEPDEVGGERRGLSPERFRTGRRTLIPRNDLRKRSLLCAY